MPMQQQTIQYATYIKNTLVSAMQTVFATHPDPIVAKHTQVTIEMPMEKAKYPAIVVRYYERDLHNMGAGHTEWIELVDDTTQLPTGQFHRYDHYGYNGDIEWAIYALSSYDRDVIGDAIAQVLMMGRSESYTTPFLDRIYKANFTTDPEAIQHFINLNTDNVMGYGESEVIAPWLPEDVMVYQKSYRIPIMGEIYSRNPAEGPVGKIERVDIFPYDGYDGEPVPEPGPFNPDPNVPPQPHDPDGHPQEDPAEWLGDNDLLI